MSKSHKYSGAAESLLLDRQVYVAVGSKASETNDCYPLGAVIGPASMTNPSVKAFVRGVKYDILLAPLDSVLNVKPILEEGLSGTLKPFWFFFIDEKGGIEKITKKRFIELGGKVLS